MAPNALMLDCTNTFATEMMEFCIPAGTPFFTICLSICVSGLISLTFSRKASFPFTS